MKITIVSIVYNGENEIEKTIQSVLRQKTEEVEYIIVDGMSTDHTMEIVRRYSGKIDLIISEKDSGIADAFNKGIKSSNGEFIGLINCGDLLADGAINFLLQQKNAIANYDVLYGNCRVNDIANNRIYEKKAFPMDFIKYGLPFSHQSCFVSKSAYMKYGLYDENYRICMDYALLRKMYANGANFYYIPYTLSVFSTGGISYSKPVATMKEAMSIAVMYGLPKINAIVYATKHIVRHYLKLGLQRLGIFKALIKLKK